MAKHVITNAAEITILDVIDHTYKTGGGPVSVGATVVVAEKGPVGTVTQVTAENWQDIFGLPLPKKQSGMEGLRHLSEAVKECNYVNVVRCVAADAKFPALTYTIVPGVDPELDTSTVTASAQAYATDLTLAENDMFILRPIDGDPSTNRRVVVSGVDADKKRFTVTIYDKDSLGAEYELESYEVGVDPSDKDDMGLPAFIEAVFENTSDRFRVDWNDELTWTGALEALNHLATDTDGVAFAGGTNGTFPTVLERQAAWELLRNEKIVVNLMFAAGEYEGEVLATVADIADERHCSAFIDAPPYMKHDDAIDWLTGVSGVGIKSRHVRCYHSPYSASDPWRGGKTVWGVAGAAAAAKARGNANYTGVIPGIHYSPAGTKRGFMERTGVAPLFADDVVNRDDLYDARINPVVYSANGGAYIDDDLTLHYESNYSRFGWVNDILDYIEARFLEAAAAAKHEPDGLTRNILTDLTKTILDDLVTSGALVTPRDASAGTKPYILTVTQKEIDLWHVQWDVCPTGAARRIAGQPKLVR